MSIFSNRMFYTVSLFLLLSCAVYVLVPSSANAEIEPTDTPAGNTSSDPTPRVSPPVYELNCTGSNAATCINAGSAAPGTQQFKPLVPLNDSSKLQGLYEDTGNFSGFVNRAFFFSIILGAILAVLRLAWGGYLYMGSEMWSDKGHAREVIRETVLGLLLLLSVWLVLTLINPGMLSLQVGITAFKDTSPDYTLPQADGPTSVPDNVPATTEDSPLP